jgi:bacterioferritin-associated ferredoxin
MIVCVCRAVCERTVRKTIEQGACSVEEIGEACRAGTSCGSCVPAIAEMLAKSGAANIEGAASAPRPDRRFEIPELPATVAAG